MGELERQVARLVSAGYPGLVGLGEEAFRERLDPLAALVSDGDGYAVVVAGVAPLDAVARLELRGKPGFSSMDADDLARFGPIPEVDPPNGFAYLITGIDTGAATLNVTPELALPRVLDAGRSPLTIPEGLAIATQHPGWLRERNCFSLLGSRCGDRRVPALWVKADGRPRLGWCWDGAPHTWLGSASCEARVGL